MPVMLWQRERPMEPIRSNKTLWLVILGLLLILVVGFFLTQKGCKQEPQTKTDTLFIPGKTDSVYIPGEKDTITKYIPYPVYIEKPTGTHFGKDSSIYQIANQHGNTEVVTFPATDSIRMEIEPITIEHFITQVDTLKLHTTDTLKITNTIEIESPWYDSFWAGAASVILVALGIVGLL